MNNQNLMTPSASPAPFRRPQAGPSPIKRPRLASSSTPSTSSTSFVSTPPAFSNQTYHTVAANADGPDLHDARRASSFRVLNLWSQLAERYSRPLAEDDIVDLRTGDFVKDRNVIRSTPHQYDIGFFGHLDGTETPTTDEGSDDELDAFAPGADISDELEMERVSREGLDPVREMDPADAQDLREFLEAESRRREEFGSDGEESLGREDGESGNEYSEVKLPEDSFTDGSTDEVEDELFEDWPDINLNQTGDLVPDSDSDSKEDDSTYIVRVKDPDDADSSSDDELGIWDDYDDGSVVYTIAGDLDSDDLADGQEVIELPVSGTSPPIPRKRGRPRKSSQSLPPPPPVRARSRSKSKSKSRRNMSPPIVQLHTPPQSSSSVTDTTPDTFALSGPVASSSTPVRGKSKSKSTPMSKGKSKSMWEGHELSSDTYLSPSKKSTPKPAKLTPGLNSRSKQMTPSPSKKPRWELEVVITRATSNSPITTSLLGPKPRTRAASKSQSRPEVLAVSDDGGFAFSPRSEKGKGKGKDKGKSRAPSSPEPSPVPIASEEESESDDPMALVSSSPERQHPRRTPAQELSPSVSESEYYRLVTPLPNPSTPTRGRGRKRKRVLSSSLEADAEDYLPEGSGDPGMELPMISPDIDLIDFSKRNYDSYGMGIGRGSPVPVSKSSSHARSNKRKSGERASSSKLVDSDPVTEPSSPPKITNRSRSSSRARLPSPSNSLRPSSTSPNAYHYPYSEIYTPRQTPNPNHNYHHATSVPPPQQQHPPVPPMQGPQAQYLLTQAMHHLSYLMTASGHAAHPHPNTGHPSWPQSHGPGPSPSSYGPPPQFNSHSVGWTPFSTPTHLRHRQRPDVFDLSPIASSSSASTSASAYTTPVHPHPYPYAFTPSLSNSTLPPSSPDRATSVSPHTSPGDVEIIRSQPLARGRSKSRGRRVSFRIDDDRPHGLNEREQGQGHALPLRFEEDQENDADELGLSGSSNRDRSKIMRRGSSSGRRSPTPRSKGKTKATLVMDAPRDESEPDESRSRARSKQPVRRYERGQTPGPPSITPASRSRSILRHKSNTPGI